MANTLSPNGFQVSRNYGASPPNYAVREELIAYNNTNKIARFDPVKLLSSGFIDVMATGGSTVHGVFLGCEYWDIVSQRYLFQPYWPAPSGLASNVVVRARVIVDPMLTFIAQVQGGPVVQGDIGNNIDIQSGTSGAPNATGTGISTCALGYSTKATTSTLPFRIVGIVAAPGPTVPGQTVYDPTQANNWVEVRMNTSDALATTGI